MQVPIKCTWYKNHFPLRIQVTIKFKKIINNKTITYQRLINGIGVRLWKRGIHSQGYTIGKDGAQNEVFKRRTRRKRRQK